MEISDIKSRLCLAAVLSHYSLAPDRNGRLLCPWHDDKTPSLQTYPSTNTWTCFSSKCNAGSGDVIDFIMKYEGISKHKALKIATELAGGDVKVKTDYGRTALPKSDDLGRQAVLTKYYQSSLQAMARGKKGKEYAISRSLDVDRLRVGFCGYDVGKTWNTILKEQAEKLGLFKIKNCLIFPTKDKSGQIVSVYGRSIGSNPKARHFYLQGGHRGLYPRYPQPFTQRLILTESIIDAASIRQHLPASGVGTDYQVLALYGTNGFTAEHKAAIENLADLEEIILFFDGDEAGAAAREKYPQILSELRPQVRLSYVDTPSGEDPNSLIQSQESEIINHLIESRFFFSTEKEKPTEPRPSTRGQLDTSNSELLQYTTDSVHITILGGIKITGLDRLKVTVKIVRNDKIDTLPLRHSLDLYHSKQVEQLTAKMSESLELGATESERIISHMTGDLETYRQQRLDLLKPKKAEKKTMTEAERSVAIAYLQDPKLLRNTLDDISKSGIVGERQNALIAYLAYTSRKRAKPLHIMCLGASGTGKTYLQEKVSELIPEEEKIEMTSLSDNAFYYFGREELKHKLILIEDLDGAENVLYPLRELQSKRRISKTVTLKDNKGNLKTITLVVEGPVCVSGCTTRERIYEDNANRCILLYIDDSSDQDRRIMHYQQRASAGIINTSSEQHITSKLQDVQRMLRPIKVINPYAEYIDLPQEVFKPRRTLLLLLSFIETITFYHQRQRPQRLLPSSRQPYIESTVEDVRAGFSLMKEVLFSKSDELSKASRRFLENLKSHVKDDEIFYTQEVRKALRVSSSTIHCYIRELKQMGYIKYKGGNKHKGYEYQITDYQEYERLRNSIDKKLEAILAKIKSIPVSQSNPTSENGMTKQQVTSTLT